jgi:putative tryptophan/tyrosine transport system substrate-binding protein
MRRREFIAALGGAAAWPLAVRAQQPVGLRTIGFLGPASASAMSPWKEPFERRLRELGWVEGRTIANRSGQTDAAISLQKSRRTSCVKRSMSS